MGRVDYETCPRGHTWDEANSLVRNGQRACRACSRESTARFRARKAGRPEPPRSPLVARELYPGGLKRCCECQQQLPLAKFTPQTQGRHLSGRCRACAVRVTMTYEREHPDRARETRRRGQLRRTYGITLEQYEERLTEQDSGCAICGAAESRGRSGLLFVDHLDLPDGGRLVRGLLCNNCNGGLGRFADDPHRLRAAASYLAAHRAQSVDGSAAGNAL